MTKQFLILLTALFALSGATACNTMAGIGEDVEAGGEALKESAEETKGY